MSIFSKKCIHDYILINQVQMDSEFEICVQNHKIPNTWCSLKRKLITDYKCNKCGKLIRFIEVTASNNSKNIKK